MGGVYSVRDTTASSVVRGESERRERVDAVAFGTGTKDYSLWVRLSLSMPNVPHSASEGRAELCLYQSPQQRYPQAQKSHTFHSYRCVCSLSDPFAVLYAITDDSQREVGRTEVIPNNLSNALASHREKTV